MTTTKATTTKDSGEMKLKNTLESYPVKLAERIVAYAAVVLFAVLSFQARGALLSLERHETRLDEVETWIAVTEGNRFTAKDGLEMQKSINALMAKIPDQYPPADWLEHVYSRDIGDTKIDIGEIKSSLKEISSRIQTVERDMMRRAKVDPD